MNFDQAKALAQARSSGLCEGCGLPGPLDPHHRMTRGLGGVHRVAASISNDVRNLLMLCRPCHDRTLEGGPNFAQCIADGWVIERRAGVNPVNVPANIYTVNGRGWWFLTADAGYLWFGEGNSTPFFQLTYMIENKHADGYSCRTPFTVRRDASGRRWCVDCAAELNANEERQ